MKSIFIAGVCLATTMAMAQKDVRNIPKQTPEQIFESVEHEGFSLKQLKTRIGDFNKGDEAQRKQLLNTKTGVVKYTKVKGKDTFKWSKLEAGDSFTSLSTDKEEKDPLKKLAGLKSESQFQVEKCKILRQKFPELLPPKARANDQALLKYCQDATQGRARVENNDRVETLARTITRADNGKPLQITKDPDEIPVRGTTSVDIWTDHYWPYAYGGLATRYYKNAPTVFKKFTDAISFYSQPADFKSMLTLRSAKQRTAAVNKYSPAEKMDFYTGTVAGFEFKEGNRLHKIPAYPLTQQQKLAGRRFDQRYNDIMKWAWMGYCHGWAEAAVASPKAVKTQTISRNFDRKSVKMDLYPADVRAWETLRLANGTTVNAKLTASGTNFVGGRCNFESTQQDDNGRILNQDCFDVNMATLYHSVGNLIGIAKKTFIIDATWNAEVWNHPIYRYWILYFTPLENPKARGTKLSWNWNEMALPYDDAFKNRDPFGGRVGKSKKTRGTRLRNGKYDDSKIKKVVGVAIVADYLVEAKPPVHGRTPEKDLEFLARAVWTGDLELEEKPGARGRYIATGGEKYQNDMPDFLWVPQEGSFTFSNGDERIFDLNKPTQLKQAAGLSAKQGQPLCKVVQKVLKGATKDGKTVTCLSDFQR